MGQSSERCSAVVELAGRHVCKNGFPVTGACLGASATPVCMQEELCGRLYAETGGRPQFLTEQLPEHRP